MSMFGSIMSKIFGHPAAAPAPAMQAPATQASASPAAAAPADTPAPLQTAPAAPAPATPAQATPAQAAPAAQVDVGAVLAAMAAQNGQKLNYKTSIVDLLKLLSLDSSLDARKTLAGELHFSGSTDDSAGMNIWLHKAVMDKLAENGGVVPADLKGA